jgi:hypothetical protein
VNRMCHNFIAFALSVLAVAALSASTGSRDSGARHSGSATSRHRTSKYQINPDMTYPTVSSGMLLQFLRDSSNRQTPNITLINLESHRVKEMRLWFDDSADVHIVSATASPDASVVVSGYARSKEGITAKYIAQLDSQGTVIHVIRTNPYLASSVCLTADGFVWTAGRVDKLDVPETYRVIRKWSLTTGLKATALPYADFSLPSGIKGEANSGTFFRCTHGGMFLYRGTDGLLARIDPGTLAVTKTTVKQSTSGAITTDFECLEDGSVYSSIVFRQDKRPKTVGEILYAKIAGTSSSWNVQSNLPVNAEVDSVPVLRGVDAGSLVFANQSAASDPHFVELVWTNPQS